MTLTIILSDEQLEAIARRVAALQANDGAKPLTIRAASAALGLSEKTIQRRVRAGLIPTVTLSKRPLIPADFIRKATTSNTD